MLCRNKVFEACWSILLIVGAPISGKVCAATDTLALDIQEVPRWDKLFNLRTWSGYKDNVLLSHENAVKSPFVAAGFDAFLWRLPENGWEWLLLGSGEYTRYLPGNDVDNEALASIQAQVKKDFGQGWKAGTSLEYLYLDQVFDNSVFDRQFRSIPVQGHIFTIRSSVRRDFPKGWFSEIEGFVTRQNFQTEVDDEWQAGPRLTLGHQYGHQSEISFGYQLMDRQFETREPRGANGEFVPGKSLEFFQHEVFATWRHYWDAQRRWRTATRLSLQRNDDNDSGYYDYYRPRISQQVRYATKTWQIRADAMLTYYNYDIQPVSFIDPSLRRRCIIQAGIRVEKNILKSLKLFAEYEHEHSLSNLSIDAYEANTVFAGIDWEF